MKRLHYIDYFLETSIYRILFVSQRYHSKLYWGLDVGAARSRALSHITNIEIIFQISKKKSVKKMLKFQFPFWNSSILERHDWFLLWSPCNLLIINELRRMALFHFGNGSGVVASVAWPFSFWEFFHFGTAWG